MTYIIDEFDLPEPDFDVPSLGICIPDLELLPLPELDLLVVELPDLELPTLDLPIEPLDFD